MDAQTWMTVLAGVVLGAGLGWGAATFWFGRKLAASASTLAKSEEARKFAAQQAAQARKQIATLQQELGDLRQATKSQAQSSAKVDLSKPSEVMLPMSGATTRPTDGFADTQLLPRKG